MKRIVHFFCLFVIGCNIKSESENPNRYIWNETNSIIELRLISSMEYLTNSIVIHGDRKIIITNNREISTGKLKMSDLDKLINLLKISDFFSLKQSSLEAKNLTYGLLSDGYTTILSINLNNATNTVSGYGLESLVKEHPNSHEIQSFSLCVKAIENATINVATNSSQDANYKDEEK